MTKRTTRYIPVAVRELKTARGAVDRKYLERWRRAYPERMGVARRYEARMVSESTLPRFDGVPRDARVIEASSHIVALVRGGQYLGLFTVGL